ncbi:MAG: hypothetical protein J0H92_18940 [Sphingobacteriales bacterium]|jgi:hypothetical protein|nr:hypothetical protein [Sphingobacteriales bacterium]OJW31846.1 MAG: hypothetical protein BGO54_15540 [Sphingobacteriales bacterium 46-32]
MKKTTTIVAVVGILMLCSWTGYFNNDIKKAGWLIGTWENKTQRGSLFETWIPLNENEFSGKSYMVKDKDTMVFETIRLLQEKEQLFYIPVVKNQNEGQPVRFALKSISENSLVFENPVHDFPQLISYTRITSDSLLAEISGTRNGQPRSQRFPMKKVK